MDGGPSQPQRSLALLLSTFQHGAGWTVPEGTVVEVAQQCDIPMEAARKILESHAEARFAIENYVGREIGNAAVVGLLYGNLRRDFGLGPSEADRLVDVYFRALLLHHARLTNAGAADRQDVLRHVAELRECEQRSPMDRESTPVFLKALNRFPDPEPDGPLLPVASTLEERTAEARRESSHAASRPADAPPSLSADLVAAYPESGCQDVRWEEGDLIPTDGDIPRHRALELLNIGTSTFTPIRIFGRVLTPLNGWRPDPFAHRPDVIG